MKCVICGETFQGIAKLELHYLIHGEGPHTCRTCGVEKETIAQLSEHFQEHADTERINCEICNREVGKGQMAKHLSYHYGKFKFSIQDFYT